MIVLYLVSIILANFSVYLFGAAGIYINAFLLIGFDLASRDTLHERWKGKRLFGKMFLLILTGSLLTLLLNTDTWRIGLASCVSFAAAGIVDGIVYQLLISKRQVTKANLSNVVSSAVDSLIFPTIAFGGFNIVYVLGQFICKSVGGYMWNRILITWEQQK